MTTGSRTERYIATLYATEAEEGKEKNTYEHIIIDIRDVTDLTRDRQYGGILYTNLSSVYLMEEKEEEILSRASLK